jgi:hypothetical protein
VVVVLGDGDEYEDEPGEDVQPEKGVGALEG